MDKAHEEIASAALSLPAEARAELAERLLDSLERVDRATLGKAWAVEAERRIDQLDRGEAKLIPGHAFIVDLVARFG